MSHQADLEKPISTSPKGDTTRVQLFVTCLVDHFFPDVGFAVVKILEALGLEVEFPQAQTCCGQPAFNGGFWDDARAMARYTIDVLAQSSAPIVVPSGSCADMLIHHYPEILADAAAYAAKAREVAQRTYEFSQFLVDVLGVTDETMRPGGEEVRASGCLTYHASCHGLRGLGIKEQPQKLLNQIEGVEFKELPEAEACCGFGGLFAVKMGDISGAILQRKLDNIEATGADIVVGGDVSCLMHIAGGLRRRGSRVQVKHLAEVLANCRGLPSARPFGRPGSGKHPAGEQGSRGE
jgi:L-lactate dehydrogenase complex protein LldE